MNKSQLLVRHYQSADRLMLNLNIALMVLSLCLAPLYDTWLEALLIGLTILGGVAALYYTAAGTTLSRASFGIGIMLFSALHIHQTNGMVEVHFGVFVLLGALLFYRDWVPIVSAALTIAVHHLVFFILQDSGVPVWLLLTTETGIWIVAVHAAYVVAEAALLVYLAERQKAEYLQARELMEVTSLIVKDEQLDLTIRSSGDTRLLKQFDEFTTAVSSLAEGVREAVVEVNKHGASLQESSSSMAQISDQRSIEINQIAESVTDLSSSMHSVGDIANRVAEQVEEIDKHAERGTEVGNSAQNEIQALAEQVKSAKDIITTLHDRSTAISGVLDVIKTIADQTNLLALNAAIEAARAGEQGRGFAVVADEVRTLAQRTQGSTEEIDRMIEALMSGSESSVDAINASEKHVESCLGETLEAQEVMQQLRKDISNIKLLSKGIAGQTSSQLEAVTNISGWTDRLASGSEEVVLKSQQVASAGKAVVAQAADLESKSSRFKTH